MLPLSVRASGCAPAARTSHRTALISSSAGTPGEGCDAYRELWAVRADRGGLAEMGEHRLRARRKRLGIVGRRRRQLCRDYRFSGARSFDAGFDAISRACDSRVSGGEDIHPRNPITMRAIQRIGRLEVSPIDRQRGIKGDTGG